MRKVIILVISLSLLWLGAAFTSVSAQMIPTSQMISVRVDDKPLNVEYIVIVDEVFVPAEEMKKVFQETFTWDPGTLWVSIGNKETSVKGLTFQDKVFLPLKGMAVQFGYAIDWDNAKNTLNIKTKKALSEQKTPTAEKQPASDGQSQTGQSQTGQSQAGQSQAGQSQTGQSQAGQSQTGQSQTGQSQTGQQSQTGEKQQNTAESQTAAAEKQPVTGDESGERRKKTLTISLFREDPITNVLEQVTALRIYADVKNSRNRPLKNVVAHCIFRYPEGEVFLDDTVTIEKMDPGESRRVVFYTINPVQAGKLRYEMTVKVQKPAAPRND
ncbi:MAG: hypothetical protein AB2L14_08020 [Candidatus Xenobiia bacterium LiM19]